MPLFSYRAVDREEQEVAGSVEAGSLRDAIDKVRALGYYPIDAKEKASDGFSSFLSKGGLLNLDFGKNVKKGHIRQFTRDLANLLHAGFPLSFSLSMLHDRQKSGRLRNMLGELVEDVRDGMSFPDALAKRPALFDDLYVSIIRGGAERGDISATLDRLAVFTEKRQALSEKIQKTRMRLVIMTLAATGFIFFLLALLVPSYAEIISDLGGALPAPAHFLLRISETHASSYSILLCYIGGIIIGIALLFKIGITRAAWHALALRIPILSRGARMVGVAQFTRALGALITSGVSVSQAFGVAGKAIDNRALSRTVRRGNGYVEEGASISETLRRSGAFPSTVLDMIAAGERDGNLASILPEIANSYDESVNLRIDRMARRFTYALLAILLVVFLFILSIIDCFPMFINPGELI